MRIKLLSYILNIINNILDWWNGTRINYEKKYLYIQYRYRMKKYEIHLPFDYTKGQLVGIVKDKKIFLRYQLGISCYVTPKTLGFDSVGEVTFDD